MALFKSGWLKTLVLSIKYEDRNNEVIDVKLREGEVIEEGTTPIFLFPMMSFLVYFLTLLFFFSFTQTFFNDTKTHKIVQFDSMIYLPHKIILLKFGDILMLESIIHTYTFK